LFRRQHSDNSATPQERSHTAPVKPEAETAQEVGSSSESSQDVAADSLLWAKSAYKNIQQQQKSQQAQETAEDETDSSVLPDSAQTKPEVTDTGDCGGRLRQRPLPNRPTFVVTEQDADEQVGTVTDVQLSATAEVATVPVATPLPFLGCD
jgi:fused signal recognition particle receptor